MKSRAVFLAPLGALAVLSAFPLGEAQAQRACRVAEVQVSPGDAQVPVGGTYPFIANALDNSGVACDNQPAFVWSSSNSTVATVEEGGLVRGVSLGTATITARSGRGATARSGTAMIIVVATTPGVSTEAIVPGLSRVAGRPQGNGFAAFDRQPEGSGPATSLFLAPLRVTLVRGERKVIEEIRAVRADGGNASRVPIVFEVDAGGERIVSVDSFGIITSLGDTGVANVRAFVPGNSRIQARSVRIEVKGDAVQFPRPVYSLVPGTVETLSVFVPAQQRALDPAGLFQFTSSDTSRVRVNPVQPIVEAVGPGSARVTAQSSLYADLQVTINVHRRVDRLAATPADSALTLAIGGRHAVRVEALAADATPVPEAPVTWLVTDTSVARLSGERNDRVIEGRRSGRTTVIIRAPGTADRTIDRVINVRVVAGGLAVRRPRTAVPAGQRQAIESFVLGDNRDTIGSAAEYLTGRWTSNADSVARVEGNEILALRPGAATLTGRTQWDSTVVVNVIVLGDLLTVSQSGGRWDIHTHWENFSRTIPVTADTLVEGYPSYSPDGMRIAFTAPSSPAAATQALYVMNADGTGRVRLTNDSAVARYPRWSDDGARLYFDWNYNSRYSQIWVHQFGPDGAAGSNSQVTRLTPGTASQMPAVLPQGGRIAYVSRREVSPGREQNVILQANPDGSEERRLTSSQTTIEQPLYSPDGRTLYFLRSETSRNPIKRVYRMPTAGGPGDTASALTPAAMFVQSFAVSPGGQRLALHVIETVGGVQRPRVTIFTIATGETTPVGTPGDAMASPAFRPALGAGGTR